MAKLVWFLVLITTITANDINGVLPLDDDTKIEKFDVHKEIKDSLKSNKISPTDDLKKIENSKDLDETILRPIGPIFPSFLQPANIIGRMPSIRNDIAKAEVVPDMDSSPHNGILTIVLVKSKNFENPENNKDVENLDLNSKFTDKKDADYRNNLINSAEKNFKTLTQFLLYDLFGGNVENQNSELTHTLGGYNDPDHLIQFSNGEKKDFIRYVKGEDIPLFRDDFGKHHNIEYKDDSKKCNFLRFLKLKAQIHYRTIVHLIFISCIVLIFLMMISLTLRVNKRRNLSKRYYKQNNGVPSIDSAFSKKQEAEKLGHTYHLGSLRATYEQRMAPPAYDQINIKQSPLIRSLASEYKNRYQQKKSEQEEDRKSLTSLPPYDKLETKN